MGAAVALETLKIYDEMNLPEHIGRMSALLSARLETLRGFNRVGDVRIKGLLAAVEMQGDPHLGADLGPLIGKAAEARGVFFRIIGNVIAIAPPYIATDEDLTHICDVLADSIREVTSG